MGIPAIKFPPTELDPITFGGGLDVVTPALQIPTGYCRAAQNYEIDINGGYKGVTGYERFDGRTRPSDAAYAILNATITGAFAVGNTLTGATSGATSKIAASAAGYFVITQITGTYQNGENLNVGGPTIAVAVGTQTVSGASTAKLHAQYKSAAADIYRAAIAAVPGSGAVLGVFQYNDVKYAIRNNAGATAAVIHKSSAAGWVAVPTGEEISFTAGGTNIDDGDTLTQGGVTATIKRVVATSGTKAGGTLAGRLVIYNRAGGNFAAGAATTTGAGALTLSGAQTAITILPGGRYEFDIRNFGGQLSQKRVYGCDAVNRGFDFDGTDYGYVPITTGMSPDAPTHVMEHKKQLFFSFASSAQHSGFSTADLYGPYVWSPITGAAELAVGDTITAYARLVGSEQGKGALAIFTKNSTSVLYGSASGGSDPWNLVNYNDEQGSIAYTTQNIEGKTVSLDTIGLISLATTANYGNFISATLSRRVQTWLKTRRSNAKSSCVVRDKSQYRIFFSDKYALYVTFSGGKILGMMPIRLEHSVDCIWSGEKNDGTEEIYFGSSDGFVYQMERGTSHDGADINGYLHLVWNSQRNVRQRKHYKHVMFEVSGDGYAEFNFRYELGYNDTDIPQPSSQLTVTDFSPAFWDAFVWDQFTWDGSNLTPSTAKLEGDAENISLIIYNSADYFAPMRFSGAVVSFIRRRGLRSRIS